MNKSLNNLPIVYLSFFGAATIWLDAFYAVNIILATLFLFKTITRNSFKISALYFMLANLLILINFFAVVSVGGNIHWETVSLFFKAIPFLFIAMFWIDYNNLTLTNFIESKFHKLLMLSGFLQCILVLFMFLFPSLKQYIYSISTLYILEKYHNLSQLIRVVDPGIGGSSFGFFICALATGAEIFLLKTKINIPFVFRFCIRLIVMASLFITARSGFILLLLVQFLIMLKFKSKELFIHVLMLILLISMVVLNVHIFEASKLLDWGLETFSNPLESKTVVRLLRSFYLPLDATTFFFGGENYRGITDSLLIKVLYSIGILALLILIILPVILMFIFINISPDVDKYAKFYTLAIFIILIIGNLKESLWASSRGAGLFFILFICLCGAQTLSRKIR